MSNLTLNVMDSANNYVPQPITQQPPIGDSADCYAGSTDMWSVSQATPVRSVIINGNLNFQAYCSETNYNCNNYGSGSYVANSEINGQLDWSGNQQGIARNSDFDSTAGYVWNYVYSGDGCPPGYTPPAGTACSPTQDVQHPSLPTTQGTNGVPGHGAAAKPRHRGGAVPVHRLERELQRLRAAVQQNSTRPELPERLRGRDLGSRSRASSSRTRPRRSGRSTPRWRRART